eukprot:6193361-Pleurochrysis_carterae.AAC.2
MQVCRLRDGGGTVRDNYVAHHVLKQERAVARPTRREPRSYARMTKSLNQQSHLSAPSSHASQERDMRAVSDATDK